MEDITYALMTTDFGVISPLGRVDRTRAAIARKIRDRLREYWRRGYPEGWRTGTAGGLTLSKLPNGMLDGLSYRLHNNYTCVLHYEFGVPTEWKVRDDADNQPKTTVGIFPHVVAVHEITADYIKMSEPMMASATLRVKLWPGTTYGKVDHINATIKYKSLRETRELPGDWTRMTNAASVIKWYVLHAQKIRRGLKAQPCKQSKYHWLMPGQQPAGKFVDPSQPAVQYKLGAPAWPEKIENGRP